MEMKEVIIKREGRIVKVNIEGEDGVVKIGMKGESSVEGLINNIEGGGGEKSKEK